MNTVISIEKVEKEYDETIGRNILIKNIKSLKPVDKWRFIKPECFKHFNIIKETAPFVDISFNECLELFEEVGVVSNVSKKEDRQHNDKENLFLRYLSGTFGEFAVCTYFNLEKRKKVNSPGGSYTNDFADMLPWGYKIGVKNSKVGNSVKINKDYLYDQIICQYEILDMSETSMISPIEREQKKKYGMHQGQFVRVYLCGVLNKKLQLLYCDREFLDGEDIYLKNSKVGFIDFEKCDKTVLSSKNLDIYKIDLVIENLLYNIQYYPTYYMNFINCKKTSFVYLYVSLPKDKNNIMELKLTKYSLNSAYQNAIDSDNIDVSRLFKCEDTLKTELNCVKLTDINTKTYDFRKSQYKMEEILNFCSESVVIGYAVSGVLHSIQSAYVGSITGQLTYIELDNVINCNELRYNMSLSFIEKDKCVWLKFLDIYKNLSHYKYVRDFTDVGVLSYHRILEYLNRYSEDKKKLNEECSKYFDLFNNSLKK